MTRFGRTGSGRPLVLRWAACMVLVGGLALTTAGCGGDDGGSAKNKVASGGGSAGKDQKAGGQQGAGKDDAKARYEQMVKFASCMRENGIDMPDPEQGEGGAMRMPAMTMDGDMSKTENAMKACEKFQPKLDFDPNDPKFKEWQAKRAACMRENGVENMDDGGGGAAAVTIDASDDKVMKAIEICNKKVPPFEKQK
ncbi:hypothetical protein B4N89_03085 [Embleya scabrispora]|uniref:Uncharacterized protein n=1 Tax=Embleya scabrispora TaxID=159449 RepID=A0A1T3NTE3_9ACTN|nr:hypothetical protein [Embleya scabrispora]OPC80068.1 hypothetical protein B4N89_03085 [Embleya scabrispora]